MPSVMVIVSKAVFEKAAGKSPKLGDQLHMDRYVTANKALEPVKQGGKLYLVTVRPPDEALWLVAVLDNPKFDGKQWKAAAADTPITDISALRHPSLIMARGVDFVPDPPSLPVPAPNGRV